MNNIEVIDNLIIITKDNKKICKKKTNNKNKLLLNYLNSKDFHNYINTVIVDGYEVRDYIDEVEVSYEDKLRELTYIVSLLHMKTTHYKNYSLNDIKLFYEKNTEEILNIKNYYNNLVEKNDIYLFLKPSIRLLIDKISLILISLDNSKYFLDKWYDITKDKQRKRVVLNHNNLKITNLIMSCESYLINFNNHIVDYPIYDLISIYKNNYQIIDMIDLYKEYNNRYKLYEEEKYLFFSLLLKINIIDFNNIEIINTRKISEIVNYLESVSIFLKDCMNNQI